MKKIVLLLALVASPATAQQLPPDSAFLQRALNSVVAQRNQALDAQAVAEAKAAGLTDDLAKANARIKELEPRPEKKSD